MHGYYSHKTLHMIYFWRLCARPGEILCVREDDVFYSINCQRCVCVCLFAGFEVSGIIDGICPSMSDCSLADGDRVVVYPTEQELAETGSVDLKLLID